ncbi:MAG: hypothetical protein K9N35_10240 [Candidatus Marinimicrobia bacterium]|nr:hypothetical protein [Candidatus Neomarinimicrobiota bacterium]
MKKLFSFTVLLSSLIYSSCSTLSFIPTEGGASKFNLATVEYVQVQSIKQQTELMATLSEHVTMVLDSLLADDRASLDAFVSQLSALDSALLELSAKLDTSNMAVDRSLALMSKELTSIKTNASSTRMVIRRVNDNIDKLPLKALEAFNEAINAYLKKDEAVTE